MRFFLDSSKIEEARFWKPVIDGATTNPKIMQKDGTGSLNAFIRELAPMPVSVEVVSEDWEKEAVEIHNTWENAVIKIPILHEDGKNTLDLVSTLARRNIPINSTILMSPGQVILAAKAGAAFASLFVGRIDDEGGDGAAAIQVSMNALRAMEGESPTQLIVGSVRTVGMAIASVQLGADIVTLPPEILKKMVTHQYSQVTARQFAEAAIDLGEPVKRKVKTT